MGGAVVMKAVEHVEKPLLGRRRLVARAVVLVDVAVRNHDVLGMDVLRRLG